VSYTAWWIDKTIGQGTKSEPLAYMGANDIRYVVFFLACMKTGYVVSNHKYYSSSNLTVLISYADVTTLTEKF
jgi:acyl-CoA synthetase (AMP-forming)/AMP-acid ligase II